jgi:hypothetical protein
MVALIGWAGYAARATPPTPPLNIASTTAPEGLLRMVCWNPLNIFIGPMTNYRIGDPGDGFDRITFTRFPKFGSAATPEENAELQKESLARQEFNRHVGNLERHSERMREYVEIQAGAATTTTWVKGKAGTWVAATAPSKSTAPQLGTEQWMEDGRARVTAEAVRALLCQTIPASFQTPGRERWVNKLAMLDPALWQDYSLTAE